MPEISDDGGIDIDAYELWIDDGAYGELTSLYPDEPDSVQRTYTIRNLVPGRIYRFQYRVKNSLGWSEFSPITSMLVAGLPLKPAKPELVSVDATTMTLSF
jgi:hypothetical protein